MEQQVLQYFKRLSGAARLTAAFSLIAALGVIWIGFSEFIFTDNTLPQPEPASWQAVFLTNGQVYFGHLKALNSNYYLLNEIYYTQTGTPPSGATAISPSQPNLYLVKLAGEVHGPEDAMYIPGDRILFWENLREDSQVVRTIEKIQR